MQRLQLMLIIAAYLHDIGKLAIRGGNFRENKNYEVAHAQFVNDFLENFGNDWSDIGTIASHHHGKDIDAVLKGNFPEDIKFVTWCVYMADNLSALERLEANEKEDFSHIGFPLGNIFDVLKFGDNIEVNKKDGRKPIKLTDFNADNISWKQTDEYSQLFDDFIQDLEQLISSNLQIINFGKFISQLDLLLQNWLTLVPSDTYNTQIADISLYDHSKLVVAFATFLYETFKNFEDKTKLYKFSTEKLLNFLYENNKKVFLIGGDFPGIQKYIFDGIKKSTNITKRLRARSFIVQILSEAVIEYILDKFELPRANVLINAGGKFVILVGLEDITKKQLLNQINEEINKFLLKNYPGLRFSIFGKGYNLKNIVKVKKETNEDTFKDILEDLFEELSRQKFKLYSVNLLKENIFNSEKVEGKVLCKYCGMKYYKKDEGFIETSDDRCKSCDKEIKLGENLVKLNNIFVNYKNKDGKFDFNFYWEDKEGQLLILFNKWDLVKDENYEKILGKSINLYVPKENDKVLSFEQILEIYSKKDGYLVMVKGDVDNMSLILKHGFGDYYSISRLLTFSRFLELFFGKILNNFLEQNFNQVYTIFSGGDDFVFVLPLVDNLNESNLIAIYFVNSLYRKFNQFVNYNPYLHFSLSIALFKKDTPIKIVYELGEKYLKQAKNFAKLKMKDVENKNQAKKELKKFVISGIDNDHFLLFDGEETFEDSLADTKFRSLIQFDLVPGLNSKSSLRYKVYQTLVELKEIVNKKEWADYVNLGAKLFYTLSRNGFKKENLKTLEDFIGKIEVGENSLKAKYGEQLFKLALQIYKDR